MHADERKVASEAGFTLMEVMLVLAVCALLLAGVMGFFAPAKRAAEEALFVDGVRQIREKAKTLLAARGAAAGENLAAVIAAANGRENAQLTHRFGGRVDLTATETGFLMELDEVPNDACMAYLASLDGGSLEVNGQAAVAPVSPGEAARLCNENACRIGERHDGS